VVDQFAPVEKTKAAAEMLARFGAARSALVVDVKPAETLVRAVRNIPGTVCLESGRLKARDVMRARRIIATKAAVERPAGGAGIMNLTDVIRRPLITEKTSILREDGRTIVFQVAAGANKIDIKRAVEHLLGAKVASVRTSIAHGKVKRQGRFVGQRSDWKRAYVRLRDGEKLPEFLEGA